MKERITGRRLLAIFFILWFCINIFQAVFTEIMHDEAYYFLYGKYLAWGYFDHPPMVAVLTYLSSLLFSGNLGARFMTIVLQLGTLYLIWLQLEHKSKDTKQEVKMFFIIAFSFIMFTLFGFISTPDAPLLFFVALFLYAYQGFLDNNNWKYTFLLAISMAGMIYSKYHAALVIGFVILSNLRLLINLKFWIAGIAALLLCAPHFWWQYLHDFPSYRYHLIDRASEFKWKYFMEFIPNQLGAFNPFTLGAAIYILYKYKPVNLFERAQYFLIYGFILFFFMINVRNHVQPQWTVAAAIPMMILINNKIFQDEKLMNYVRKYVTGSLILVFALRIIIITPILPASSEIWGKEAKYKAIQKVAGDKPVIFAGSFQEPSLYTFFTGYPATTVSSLESRKTQFDLWQFDEKWIGQALFIFNDYSPKTEKYTIDNQIISGFFSDSLQTTSRIKINFSLHLETVRKGDTITFPFIIENPLKHDIDFSHPDFPVNIKPLLWGENGVHSITGNYSKPMSLLKSGSKIENDVMFVIPDLPEGNYLLGISCHTIFGHSFNSGFVKVKYVQ